VLFEIRYRVLYFLTDWLSIDIIFNFRLESAVLDLVADDGAGMKKQKSQYHWDKVL